MAYSFTAASSQYLSATASPLGTGQLGDHTIALWVKGAAASPTTTAFSISRSSETGGANNPAILIQNANGAVVYFLRANVSAGGEGYINTNGGTAFDNTSRHVCVRLSSTTANIYVDGSSVATAAAAIPVQTGMDRLGVGAFVRGNVVTFYNGEVAEVGIWNVALTAAEIASLAKGMTCDKVRPQSLVFYAPLVRELQDVKGGLTITNNNTATVANHPRVYA
jgi:hypothetical protein